MQHPFEIYNKIGMPTCLFQLQKLPWYYVELEASMIFISRIMRIIIQKNTLCTNKFRVIFSCSNCVSCLTEKAPPVLPSSWVYSWNSRTLLKVNPSQVKVCNFVRSDVILRCKSATLLEVKICNFTKMQISHGYFSRLLTRF